MNSPLAEIQNLLNNFEDELSKIREIWKQLETDNPNFEQVSERNWQEKQVLPKNWGRGSREGLKNRNKKREDV